MEKHEISLICLIFFSLAGSIYAMYPTSGPAADTSEAQADSKNTYRYEAVTNVAPVDDAHSISVSTSDPLRSQPAFDFTAETHRGELASLW